MARCYASLASVLLLSNVALAKMAAGALTHEQLQAQFQAQINRLEINGFFIAIGLLACILFVLVYAERAIKRIERIVSSSVASSVASGNIRQTANQVNLADNIQDKQLLASDDAINQETSNQDVADADKDAADIQDIQHEGVLAMDGATDDISSSMDSADDISNLPGIVAQYAFPESLEALRRAKPSGTSEHDLWRWVQDVLLHLPKYGLKNDSTMMLPEKPEDCRIHHRLEQGLRYFNMNQFSDALQEFFQVSLRSEDVMQQLSADFMKMQILFRLELWVDATEIAEKIIYKYQKHQKLKHNHLVSVSFATAYMVRGAYRLQFLDDEESARSDMNKAISYTVNMDNHDMLMAGVMMHVHLFKVALHARSNPAASLKAMQTILRLFSETVIPEIQTVRDNIKEFF